MATSVPSKNGNDSGSAVELTYSGKLPRTQVLAEPANTTFRAVQKSDSPNRLFCGDNLAALKALVGDPTVQGKVSLVYIVHRLQQRAHFFLANKEKPMMMTCAAPNTWKTSGNALSY